MGWDIRFISADDSDSRTTHAKRCVFLNGGGILLVNAITTGDRVSGRRFVGRYLWCLAVCRFSTKGNEVEQASILPLDDSLLPLAECSLYDDEAGYTWLGHFLEIWSSLLITEPGKTHIREISWHLDRAPLNWIRAFDEVKVSATYSIWYPPINIVGRVFDHMQWLKERVSCCVINPFGSELL